MGKIERDEWGFDGWGHKTTIAAGAAARRRGEGGAVNQLSLPPMDAYDRMEGGREGEAMAWRVTPTRSLYPTKLYPKL